MSKAIKKGDIVVVISGAARTLDLEKRTGAVLSVDKKKNRVTVEGVNVRRRATRRSQANPEGGFVEKACPIDLSNVMLKETYDARATNRTTAK